MRTLGFILLALTLSGCAKTSHNSVQPPVSTVNTAPQQAANSTLLSSYPSVRLLSMLDDIGKPFLALGSVAGEGCQVSVRDFPTDMSVVRNQMQTNAKKLRANAVVMNGCEVSSTPTSECYRQTLCKGSALRVAD